MGYTTAIRPAYADKLPEPRKRFTDRHLLWASFARETGTWRQTYDRHVRDWKRAVNEETYQRYYADARFAAAYDTCRAKAAEAHNEWLASLRWGAGDTMLSRAIEEC